MNTFLPLFRAVVYVSFFAVLDALYIPIFRDVSFAYAMIVAFSLRFSSIPLLFICLPTAAAIMLFAHHFSFLLVFLYALPVAASFFYEHVLCGKMQARLIGAAIIFVMWFVSTWGAQRDIPALAADLLLYWLLSLIVVGPMAERKMPSDA